MGTMQIPISFNGELKLVDLGADQSSSYAKTANSFGINLAIVDAFFLENSKNGTISPLNINSVNANTTYNLLVRYKPATSLEAQSRAMENVDKPNMQDAEYFNGYANLSIHKTMLRDKERMVSYKKGLDESREFIEGKTVLDVGTGTGILSIFAADLGAEAVYSVDASTIVNDAALIVSTNGLDEKVFVLQGKIEDIELPCHKVDVIVSEWMGSMLLFESMLLSVIHARDRYLTEDGIMLPSKCDMLIAPLDIADYVEEHLGFWKNVHGVDMTVLQEKAHSEFFSFPIFTRVVEPFELLAEGFVFHSFDTKTVTEKSLDDIICPFRFVLQRAGTLHGFACWFDVTFLRTVLSTSPEKPETHWKQTMLVFDDFPETAEGTVVNGLISIHRSSVWGRHYEVIVKYWLGDSKEFRQKKFPLN